MGSSKLWRAPILIEDAPDYEFKNGLFYVRLPAADTILAYRPCVFFEAIAAAVEESRQYRTAGAEIINLHAASASGSPSK